MNKANLSIFASGAGSNLLAIHKASMGKNFPGQLQLVICNKICPAFELAKSLNYRTKLISNLDIESFEIIAHNELIEKKSRFNLFSWIHESFITKICIKMEEQNS